jgi:putative hydrolase of the HAD superfamily
MQGNRQARGCQSGTGDMMTGQIQAVLWDFGGVITSSPFEAFARFEAARGLPVGFIRQVNATSPDTNAWARLERSEIDAGMFDRMFRAEALALGHDVGGAEILPLLSGAVRPRVVRALDELVAAGLRIACITNNARVGHGSGMAGSEDQSDAIAAVLARFELVIESSKEGLRKPDPRIHQLACDRLGVAPAHCVYLDDLGINCKPAATMGMTAIKVTGEDQALAELGRVLGMALG